MACDSVNISNSFNKCDITCKFDYNYGNSGLIVNNKGGYLEMGYDGKSDVTFNGNKYDVVDTRIYKPSLNSYYGSKVDAELFIHHTSKSGKNLLLSIPIVNSNAVSPSNTLFSNIFPFVSSRKDTPVSINITNYTLNHLIPKSGFYSFIGPLPYEPCNGEYNIVMFDSKNTINISAKDMRTLQALIDPINTTPKDMDMKNVYYNKTGTINNELTGEDNIYIDCQPVEDTTNEVLTGESSGGGNASGKSMTPAMKKNIEYLEIIAGIAGGLILLHFLIKGGMKALGTSSS